MTTYTMVIVDTTGIQSYIFGSNRLRENVGASHLVHLATEGWLRDRPQRLLGDLTHNLIQDGQIESGLDVELFYAGGGNTVLLFRTDDLARQFTYKLSRTLIEDAPGLEAVAVRKPVNWDGSLAAAMDEGFAQLQDQKAARERSQPLLGLGVTAACQSTGLVANDELDEPGENGGQVLVSSEVKAKWEQNIPAKERLKAELKLAIPADFDFPSDFDELGRSKGDFSYIAVVHADGNGMGKLLESIIQKYRTRTGATANRELMGEVRNFSKRVNDAGKAALASVVKSVANWNERGWLEAGSTYNQEQQRRMKALSIRPIVFGGDDVTLVCDGRIGLVVAQRFLKAFSEQSIPTASGGTQSGVAAAGIAIVKVHYPFARAYALSEALCKNAKNSFARKAPALDWHLAQSGLFGSLGDIRQREYNERYNTKDEIDRSLLMRPVTVGDSPVGGWRTWENFEKLLEDFRTPDRWPRNKMMNLREALRQGPMAVQAFVDNYRINGRSPLYDLHLNDTQYRNTGQLAGRAVYFDAVELIEQEVLP